MKIFELKQKRYNLVQEARDIYETAEQKKRDVTQEEENRYNTIMEEVDKLGKEILRREKEERLFLEIEGDEEKRDEPAKPDPGTEQRAVNNDPRATEEYRKAFISFLNRGLNLLPSEDLRALQVGSDTSGGYVTTPMQFVTELIKAVDNATVVRQLATVYNIPTAVSLGAASLDADPDDADWTSELGTGDEDSAMRFGKRELHPRPLAKRIRVSNQLLRVAAIDIEALVRDRLAYKFAVTHESAFMIGSGHNRPLGLFTASNDGIPAGAPYDVSTGNTDSSIGADGLIEAKYGLKTQYLARSRWIFHRTAIKNIRKLKTGDGDYLWKAGLSDRPDTILEIPFVMSEYAPSTFTSGSYVGIIGDFSYYWIADALSMTIQRLVEIAARTNQTEFIGRLETDGMPMLADAFRRVTLA